MLIGRLIWNGPLDLLQWGLSVLFIPSLALTLGIWGRSSKLFEVVYPILWYLGPFNSQNQLAYYSTSLGIHAGAPVNTAPWLVMGSILVLLVLSLLGRKRQIDG